MTPTLTASSTLARPPARSAIAPDVLRSEWTKFRSVRSTFWTLLSTAVAMVGLSALLSALYVSRYSKLTAADKLTFNPTSYSLNGVLLAQLAVGVLGVLVMTSEYGTGMIRVTFAAVPQRRVVLAAKAGVLAVAAAIVGIGSSLAAFFIGQAILSSKHIQAHITDRGAVRSVFGAGLYLAVLALFALGIGAVIRRTAGAIAAVFGLIFVLPAIVLALPASWSNAVSKYLPSNAGQALFITNSPRPNLSPWTGFGVFSAYAAAALLVAAGLLTRHDA